MDRQPKVNRIVKVNFELLQAEKTSGNTFYFNTTIDELKVSQHVWVESRGTHMVGVFLGYYEGELDFIPTKKVVRRLRRQELDNLKVEQERKLVKYPLNITDEALEQYRTLFKGNTDTPIKKARAKLTRNVLMSYGKWVNEDGSMKFRYGMQLITIKNHTVIKLEVAEKSKGFKKDWNTYQRLNHKLGIDLTDKEKERYGLVK